MKLTRSILLATCAAAIFGMTACQTEDNLSEIGRSETEAVSEKEALLSNFAEVLSKVTYDRQDVREFLKTEAIKQFDKNYDVLYALIKDKEINGATFRDILVEYSSENEIAHIEANIPLLNILIPEIAFFGINADNMDCEDSEIPVAVSKETVTALYLNGICEANLKKGEVPDFHTFVVNENSRVKVDAITRDGTPAVTFISPNYDGSLRTEEPLTRSTEMTAANVGARAIAAYGYFYKDDASVNSRVFQRDYIYYGITPSSDTGTLNRNISEYISFIEVNPNAYFNMSDQRTGEASDDPRISNTVVEHKKTPYTEAELIDRMWTKGAYNFRIEIISANSTQPIIVYVPLRPDQLWDFHIACDYRHGTWFRKKKYTYAIDPNKFTAKCVYLSSELISFGKWDLSEEALYRYVHILEEDKSVKYTYSVTHEMTKMTSAKVSGGVKFGVGTKTSGEIGAEISGSTTKTESKTFSYTREEEDDNLGTIKIYFYDPIIDAKSGSNYLVHTYNTGIVKFGLAVK
ncbi:MAG: hypothetical protein K2I85_06745 [Alistipes sp.]|nr:hypothetical protein [Alistipes sp.]